MVDGRAPGRPEEGAEPAMDVGAAGKEQHAARPAVEAMHHPEWPEDRLGLLPEGALRRPSTGNDDASWWLRHGGEMFVDEQDRERHITRRTGHTSTGPNRASCFSSGPAGPTARTRPSSTGRWRAVASRACAGVTDRIRSW